MKKSKSSRGSFSALAVPQKVITAARNIELWAKENNLSEIRILNVTYVDPDLSSAEEIMERVRKGEERIYTLDEAERLTSENDPSN